MTHNHTFPPMDKIAARERIMTLAWCVAVEAPPTQNKWAKEARVDWKIVHELRQRFREAGYNVDGAIKKLREVMQQKGAA